jgi:uncharacterized protein involved in outer membrane biogenesis
MKRFGVKVLIGAGVLSLLALLVLKITLNSAIKARIEDTGRAVTKVAVNVGGVDISLFTGTVVVSDLRIGNPAGYGDATAIKLGKIEISSSPLSILSDRIVLHSMNVASAYVQVQGGMRSNNITRLQANVHAGSKRGDDKHRFSVEDFKITGGTIRVETQLGEPVSVPFPAVHFKGLGKGETGITMGELFSKVFYAVSEQSQDIAIEVLKGSVKGVGKDIGKGFDNAKEGIKQLFK